MKILERLKNGLVASLMVVALVVPAVGLVPAVAFAADPEPVPTSVSASKDAACAGIGLAGDGTTSCGADAANNRLSGLIRTIISLLSVVVGVAAVIMIIVSGFKYITSGGESSKVSGAKSALIYAIVGLVVVALAQFIVHFVLDQAK